MTAVAEWDFGTTDDIAYHKVWKQNQQHFSEVNDHAEWGNIVRATLRIIYALLTNQVLFHKHR